MQETEFLSLLDEVFDVDPGTILLDHDVKELPTWDSMTFLGLIATIDERYNVTLEPDDVLTCSTAQELFHTVLQMRKNKAA